MDVLSDTFICVIRKKIYEKYESFRVHDLNRRVWSSIANKFIKRFSKPEDWKRSMNSKNYRTVPNFSLNILFNYLFDLKRNTNRNSL